MGNDESRPSTSKNEQRNSRNVSQAEVERALERQRQIYEQKMQEMLKNQNKTTPSTANKPASAVQSTSHVPPLRPVPPRPNIENSEANCLERQRTPYSYNQNNLPQATASAHLLNSSRPLYPNLRDNGNSTLSPGNNSRPFQSPEASHINDFVFVNSNLQANRFTPSAPPPPPNHRSRQNRSVSRSRSEVDNEVHCPTCKNRFGVKVYNCEHGHACCDVCRLQQRFCALCGSAITQIRNHSVEEYIAETKAPCLNVEEGCVLHFKLGEMERHLKECPFGETLCPLPGDLCRWKGKLSLLATHFENFHPNHKGDVGTETFLPLSNTCQQNRMQLIKIRNYNFIFHLSVSDVDKNIYIAVQLLGTKFSAAKWLYEVHVYDKGAPRRKYQYIDKCFSTTEPLCDLVKESKCAVIPLQYAKTFINNGTLAYKFYIKKKDDDKGESNVAHVSCTRRGRGRGRGRGHGGFNKV